MKSSEASTEVEILNTLQKTVADPNRPFDRSMVTVTLVDSVTTIGLIDFKPNSPLALSLFSTKRQQTNKRSAYVIVVHFAFLILEKKIVFLLQSKLSNREPFILFVLFSHCYRRPKKPNTTRTQSNDHNIYFYIFFHIFLCFSQKQSITIMVANNFQDIVSSLYKS